MKEAQEAITSYQQALQRIATEARNKARLAYERYYGELQAAALADDNMERTGAAWLGYQQNYAQINKEYLIACQEQYQLMVDTLQNQQLTSDTQALSGYIDLLEETRTELIARSKKAVGNPKKSASGGTKTA